MTATTCSHRIDRTAARPRRRAASRGGLTPLEALLALALLAALVLAATWPAVAGRAAGTDVSTHQVLVGQSQTLWAIARANPVPGQPTARTAALIRELNGLDDSAVDAGMVLEVPSSGPGSGFASR